MSKVITCPTFAALEVVLQSKTDGKRAVVTGEIADGLAYIGEKSGQDAPLRRALDRVEASAPRNAKTGAVTPNARRIIAAARDAMQASKLAFSRLQTANKLGDKADDYAAECAAILAEFMDKAWPARAEAAPKPALTAMDKARAAIAALSESERAAILAEFMPAQSEAPKRGTGRGKKAA